jgi:hypothetical protein
MTEDRAATLVAVAATTGRKPQHSTCMRYIGATGNGRADFFVWSVGGTCEVPDRWSGSDLRIE